ncbi:uncharacterized protein KIAA1958 homolog isoform X2 [Apus apus]|uniref:uncharacterized protein KIAA1958 homolog isoform X2 n=1 Tax=Apus apus TaxID=8895 RepID=UPI0021F82133|nr:uncharacterized protein KIAA1958 homolog isoform X2 [Apus apus]XP_051495824.1 uncharacterized protein KIAA1958 homolog isoform X2 [Apus apus]XP_051495825.1 uncharacterized protein KIAA1958 homolog isoform X2 [Apus apus]XP_051495826.1 uncharacterized protein KIAA1958 homolog isoform X2 [Apus apus]
MSRSVGDGRCVSASSLHRDLINLVTWAHAHGTICNQIPALEMVQNMDHPNRDNPVLWICGAGHAYHWQCGKLDPRSREENEAVEKRKWLVSSEASSSEASLNEKRCRMAPSFEGAKADIISTGSCSRSPDITQQKDNRAYIRNHEPSPRENGKNSKSMNSCFAVEQHLSVPGGKVKTDRKRVKQEDNEVPQIISDEEQCISDENDPGDTTNQNILSEPLIKDVNAEEELQMQCSQMMAFNKLTATQASGFAPTRRSPLTLACSPKSPVSDQESLNSSFLRSGPLNPAGSPTATCRERNSSGSAIPKQHLESVPGSNIEEKAEPESLTSVTYLDTLHLKCGTPEMGLSGNVTENSIEEREPSGSGHPSASLSPESKSTNHSPASSNQYVLKTWEKRRRCNTYRVKVFKDWLASHCPTETREICQLPPEDLDHYLASFYSSAKKQNGRDFSATSLHFFQTSVEQYLKDHNYKCSVIKGLEFRASQEALKLKQHQLTQKEREGEWSILENLTDEDMASLRKGGLLSKMHPESYLHLIFINIIRAFGARTHRQSRNLYWGQLVLQKSQGELEYLEWIDELKEEKSTGNSGPRLFAKPDNPSDCPVEDYKRYARRRPPDMLHSWDPLYLVPKPLFSWWDHVWYSRKSLTKAKIEKMLKAVIQQIKMPRIKSKD